MILTVSFDNTSRSPLVKQITVYRELYFRYTKEIFTQGKALCGMRVYYGVG